MQEIIQIQNLTKRFGSFTALNQINLQVKQGEIHGFIGPNGAGKSTTIRILLGLLKADSGTVTVFGKDAWKDAMEIHKKLAYIPGEVNLWGNLTGGQVIDLLVEMHGGEANRERLDYLIQRFELDTSKKCKTYSKGNRQKVVLIAALAYDADLYVFDEPTAGLDPLMEKVFQELVFEAKAAGKSVLLSSHILSEVERLCDNISIIRKGEIIETGSLSEMRHLTRDQLIIQTREAVNDLQNVEGIFDLLMPNDKEYHFQYANEQLQSIISHFSAYGIVKIESQHPTLEDLFLHHYENPSEVGEDVKSI